MPSWEAWIETQRSIKRGGRVQALKVRVASLKLDNVSWDWISVINLNCYMIIDITVYTWNIKTCIRSFVMGSTSAEGQMLLLYSYKCILGVVCLHLAKQSDPYWESAGWQRWLEKWHAWKHFIHWISRVKVNYSIVIWLG